MQRRTQGYLFVRPSRLGSTPPAASGSFSISPSTVLSPSISSTFSPAAVVPLDCPMPGLRRKSSSCFGPAMPSFSVVLMMFLLWLGQRSEEHTSELQSLMRISYAVFCLNKQHIEQH